jgi:cyclopropane-fatty-acyl-phospholipid synthase
MGEHVGEAHYPTYAAIMFHALRPGGKLLLQQMSRRECAAPGGGAFVERYIAPDMHMRPLWQTLRHLQSEEVARVWRLYLVGGGLASEEGRMGVDQLLAVRP